MDLHQGSLQGIQNRMIDTVVSRLFLRTSHLSNSWIDEKVVGLNPRDWGGVRVSFLLLGQFWSEPFSVKSCLCKCHLTVFFLTRLYYRATWKARAKPIRRALVSEGCRAECLHLGKSPWNRPPSPTLTLFISMQAFMFQTNDYFCY